MPKRDLDAKKTQPDIEVCPESLGTMLEYWYIERALLLLCSASNNLASNVVLAYTYIVIDKYFLRGSWRSLLQVKDLKIV